MQILSSHQQIEKILIIFLLILMEEIQKVPVKCFNYIDNHDLDLLGSVTSVVFGLYFSAKSESVYLFS